MKKLQTVPQTELTTNANTVIQWAMLIKEEAREAYIQEKIFGFNGGGMFENYSDGLKCNLMLEVNTLMGNLKY